MSHVGYFLSVEGVEPLPATEAFTGAGSWAGRTFLGCFSVGGIGSVNYSVDPHKRKADVGVLSIRMVDKHGTGNAATGVLTDLFGLRRSQTRLHLSETIEQGDVMAGAGGVTVSKAIDTLDYPLFFYIGRETFYTTGSAAEKTFGSVSRARYGSIARRHAGYMDQDGYWPEVRLAVPSWKDRQANLYRVVDGDVANASRIWTGPILDLTPSNVNEWTIRIGSVIRLLESKIFEDGRQAKLQSDMPSQIPATMTDPNRLGHWHVMTVDFDAEVVRTGLVTTGAGSDDADAENYNLTNTVCSSIDEPDGFWDSRYAIRFITGDLGPLFDLWPKVLEGGNNQIRVTESTGPQNFTVEIVTASWNGTAGELATKIAAEMTTASVNGWTYTCTANADRTFTIAESGAHDFILAWSHADATAATLLGWNAIDTDDDDSHTSPYPWDPTKKVPNISMAKAEAGQLLMITNWTNSTGKIEHYDYRDRGPSASGDYFEIVRLHPYPPSNKYLLFPAVIDGELVAIRTGTEYDFAASAEPNAAGYNAANRWPVVRSLEFQDEGFSATPRYGLDAHDEGSEIREVLTNYRMEDDYLTYKQAYSIWRLQSEVDRGIWATMRNPLLWFLELWCSTGEGWNGDYDVLHDNHGAGHAEATIDVDSFVAMAEKVPSYRLGYTKAVSLADILVRDICVPCGLYPCVDSTGRLTIKEIKQHDRDATADAVLDEGDIATDSAKATHDHVGIQPGLSIEYGWNPRTNESDSVVNIKVTDARAYYPESKIEKHKTHVWPLAVNAADSSAQDFENNLIPRAVRVLDRTGFPKVMISVDVPFDDEDATAIGINLRPGSTAQLTVANAVALPTGTRTLTAEWCEVHDVKLNLQESVASVKAYWLGWYRDKYSKWNLGALATAWNAGTKTVTLATTMFQSGEDCEDYVTAGDKIRIHYLAAARKSGGVYGDTEELTVASRSGYEITFTAAPTNAIVAGDLVCCCDYNNATTAQKKLAFLAEDSDPNTIGEETVGSGGDNPYVYV